MVVMPMFDGLFMKGDLLESGMRSSSPSEGRDGLGEDHDQH